ncbi:hypothetical protein [Nocardioides astragali]|uniref:LPXTG cell wall anchor domain-containing protein n=1 Tax=Nocardioides astragali TaxID=1776736 RepID=A0ABW2MZ66_9ACTN|nr:hypothetical protein [Nocardioides astragali]
MSTSHRTYRAPRLGVAALLCLGTFAMAPAPLAHAEPGNGAGQGQRQDPGQGNPDQGDPGQGNPGQGNPDQGDPGQGNPGQGNPDQGNPDQGNPDQQPSTSHDPAGNNGTVKIAPLGDFDGIPDNTPHVGCTFLVEWYGFDEGADIVSTVSFAEHAPTTGVGMTVSGPSQVFVGGDPATGAGTPTGLDGRQEYTLSFTGAPHPQQGYHVKLTIATPGSIGNDTKSKVFWVEGCAPTTPVTPETETPETPETETPSIPGTTSTPQAPEVLLEPANPQAPPQSTNAEVLPETANAEVLPETANAEVLPETANAEVLPETAAPEVLGVQAFGTSKQQLPTAVNAGATGEASPTGISLTQSLLGLLLMLVGGTAARLGWVRVRG